MFNRIRNYFAARRFRKKIDHSIKLLTPPAPATFTFDDTQANTLTFTNNNGVKIFSIEPNGEAVWHKEDSYNEAAAMFLHHLSMNIEDSAGIARNRQEWEKRICDTLIKHAEKAPLTADALTNVLNKCIMYDKLKGVDSGNE
jgi:hypothetical protein